MPKFKINDSNVFYLGRSLGKNCALFSRTWLPKSNPVHKVMTMGWDVDQFISAIRLVRL